MVRIRYIIIAVAVFLSWWLSPLYYLTLYPAQSVPAEFIPDVSGEPLQEETDAESFFVPDRKGRQILIDPVAIYNIGGRIAVRRTYPNYFNVVQLEEVLTGDMALVWGRFAEDKIFKKMSFSHQWTYSGFTYRDADLSRDPGLSYLSEHFSSNHLVAANSNIDHAIRQAGKGDRVRLIGYLIDLEVPGLPLIKTSTVRTDNWTPGQGNTGGSEFIYVTEFQNGKNIYR